MPSTSIAADRFPIRFADFATLVFIEIDRSPDNGAVPFFGIDHVVCMVAPAPT